MIKPVIYRQYSGTFYFMMAIPKSVAEGVNPTQRYEVTRSGTTLIYSLVEQASSPDLLVSGNIVN
jgi:hypothetical protein